MNPSDDQLAEMRVRAWALVQKRRGQQMVELAEQILNVLEMRDDLVSDRAEQPLPVSLPIDENR